MKTGLCLPASWEAQSKGFVSFSKLRRYSFLRNELPYPHWVIRPVSERLFVLGTGKDWPGYFLTWRDHRSWCIRHRGSVCHVAQGCWVSRMIDMNGFNAQMMMSGLCFAPHIFVLLCCLHFREISLCGTGSSRLIWSLSLMIPKKQRDPLFSSTHTSKEGIPTAPSLRQSLLPRDAVLQLAGPGLCAPHPAPCVY